MNLDIRALANDSVKNLRPYQPGKPISELQRELGIQDVIKLASNENPVRFTPVVKQAIDQAIADINLYPDGASFQLKERLSEQLQVTSSQLTLGNGSDEIFTLALRAFAKPNEEIIVSQYSFAAYAIAARAMGVSVVEVAAKNWGSDLDAIASRVSSKTKIIFIANPNNPTGTWCNKDDLLSFLQDIPERVIIVIDQAYLEYMDDVNYPDASMWLDSYPNLIVTRTFSKAYSLAGLRIGYGISSPEIADLLNRLRLPFNVNSLAQVAASAVLLEPQHLQNTLQENSRAMDLWQQALDKLSLKYITKTCNFFTVDMQRNGEEVYKSMLQEGVIIRPLTAYKMPNHCRISMGKGVENQRAIVALAKVIEGT